MYLRQLIPLVFFALLLVGRQAPGQTVAEHDGTADPAAPPSSFSILSGELPERLPAAQGPYKVVADIVVPPGKTVTIEPGTSLLFSNFTGVQVHGTLIAAGTEEHPIAFTSEHDKKHGSTTNTPPAPYDWNGITVTENAVGTTFEFCKIGYSLFGINALTEYFTIKNCVFHKNGKANVTIKGSRQEVVGGIAFSYEPLGESPLLAEGQRVSPTRVTLRTSSIALCVVGGGVAIWQAIEYSDANTRFEELNDYTDLANVRNPNIVEEWNVARETRDGNLLGMVIGFSGAVFGAAVFTITLF